MSVVLLNGGLGNQLFQICFALYLQKHSRDKTTVDYLTNTSLLAHGVGRLPEILDLVALETYSCEYKKLYKAQVKASMLRRSLVKRLKIESDRPTDRTITHSKNRVFTGYWQDDARLYPQYATLASLLAENLEVAGNGLNAVHMRFGDYKSKKNFHKYHQLDADYYFEAFSRVRADNSAAKFTIISDQPEHAKTVLSEPRFADFEIVFSTGSAWDDFMTLSGSRSIIASNSTFCWWAAAIANQAGHLEKLISPRDWFQPTYTHLECPDFAYIGTLSTNLDFSAL